jgi:HD-like signal output (HDOD) protein
LKVEDKFITSLLDDITHNRLVLPSLPEVALKVRKLADDPYSPAEKIAKIISTDAALSARLLQISNSVFFKGLNPVENVRTAVVRLGGVCVRNVVTSLVMDQLYNVKQSAAVKSQLHKLWVHSTRVAAISQVFARRFTSLNADEALLAGLIHDIGTLPILSRAADFPEMLKNPAALNNVIENMHQDLGKLILEDWHFPENLTNVAAEHEDISRDLAPIPDYTDIVIVANMHSYLGQKNCQKRFDWENVPALKKLGLTPEQSISALGEAKTEIIEIQKLLLS